MQAEGGVRAQEAVSAPTCTHAEEHQVSSGNVFLSQTLLSIYDHICSRRVYDVDVSEQLCGQLPGEKAVVILKGLLAPILTVKNVCSSMTVKSQAAI